MVNVQRSIVNFQWLQSVYSFKVSAYEGILLGRGDLFVVKLYRMCFCFNFRTRINEFWFM